MHKRGYLRIIGGQWKSRRLRCAAAGVRPSPDAVRETLFNWLPHDLRDTSCLDLFAGSGALGFEAASRGAAKVMMVESHPAALALLRSNRAQLRAEDRVDIFAGPVQRFIRQRTVHGDALNKFDLLLLDPPFGSGVLTTTCQNLDAHGFLNPHARVYIESQRTDCAVTLPPNWHIIRQKSCGMVHSTLIQT